MILDKKNIPEKLHYLIPYAEECGIGDDCYREEKVEKANDSEIIELVTIGNEIDDDILYKWLAGDEAKSLKPTLEYVAYTCLTMAIDSSRFEMKKRGLDI
jgi:hypothetical protein